MAGALSIFFLDQYPVAPDMVQPTTSLIKIAGDFIKGETNCLITIILTKTLKPRPINSECAPGSGFGAAILGHMV